MEGGPFNAWQLAVMAEHITAMYSSILTHGEMLHIEAIRLVITLILFGSTNIMCCKCGYQLNLLLGTTQITGAEGQELLIDISKIRGQKWLYFFLVW